MLRAEHQRWSSIAQLAGEYDTIAEHVQHDRWITLLEQTALTREQVDDVIASEAFGALAGELRVERTPNATIFLACCRSSSLRGLSPGRRISHP